MSRASKPKVIGETPITQEYSPSIYDCYTQTIYWQLPNQISENSTPYGSWN